jgi:ABC-type lipoprotein export system ATPase subunit
MHIEFLHIYKKYDEFKDATALVDVSFVIESEKRMIAIRGHNGAGKSTLLNLLGALDYPDSGKIIVDTKDITKLSRNELSNYRLHDIGIIFQFFNLFPTFTIYENIAIPGYLAGTNRKKLKMDIESIAELVGIKHILMKYPAVKCNVQLLPGH